MAQRFIETSFDYYENNENLLTNSGLNYRTELKNCSRAQHQLQRRHKLRLDISHSGSVLMKGGNVLWQSSIRVFSNGCGCFLYSSRQETHTGTGIVGDQ